MSDSSHYYDSDSLEKAFNYMIILYIIGSILALLFWAAVIYFCIRGCRAVAERPQIVQVQQPAMQPQVHYIVYQEGVDANGRPVMYAQPPQPGQQYPVVYANPPPGANGSAAAPSSQNV